jgi:hypothetical protein
MGDRVAEYQFGKPVHEAKLKRRMWNLQVKCHEQKIGWLTFMQTTLNSQGGLICTLPWGDGADRRERKLNEHPGYPFVLCMKVDVHQYFA